MLKTIGCQRLFICLLLLLSGKTLLLSQEGNYNEEALQEDLNYLYESITQIHPNPYTRLDSLDYAHLFDSLFNSLSEMNRTGFLFHLAPLFTQTNDGHLNISFGKKRFLGGRFGRKKRQRETMNMPLAIRKVEDSYLVAGNLSLDTIHFKRGTEVLSLGGQSLDQLIRDLGQFSGGSDGPSLGGRDYWTLRFLPDRYRHFFGEQDSFSMEVIPFGDSTVKEIKVASLSILNINQIAAKRYGGKKTPVIGFNPVNDTISLGRIDIRSFTHPKDFYNWRFSKKLKRAFRSASEQAVQHLVIDLRGNGGGALNNAAMVARYLLDKPFRLGKEVSLNAGVHKNKQVKFANRFNLWLRFKYRKGQYRKRKNAIRTFKPKKKWQYDGQVYLLTDAGSFSATANLVAKLKSEQRAIIFGEATGGGYFMDFGGFFQYITLPNTNLRFRIPLIQYINDVDPILNPAAEILPDIEVSRTKADFLKKKDTVMERINEYVIKQKR